MGGNRHRGRPAAARTWPSAGPRPQGGKTRVRQMDPPLLPSRRTLVRRVRPHGAAALDGAGDERTDQSVEMVMAVGAPRTHLLGQRQPEARLNRCDDVL